MEYMYQYTAPHVNPTGEERALLEYSFHTWQSRAVSQLALRDARTDPPRSRTP